MVAAARVVASSASVAKRIAGSYRKNGCKMLCRCLRPKKATPQSAQASVDRLTSLSKGTLCSQGSSARLSAVEHTRVGKKLRAAPVAPSTNFGLAGAEYKKVTCKVHLQTRVELRRHGGAHRGEQAPKACIDARGNKVKPYPKRVSATAARWAPDSPLTRQRRVNCKPRRGAPFSKSTGATRRRRRSTSFRSHTTGTTRRTPT